MCTAVTVQNTFNLHFSYREVNETVKHKFEQYLIYRLKGKINLDEDGENAPAKIFVLLLFLSFC